MAGPGGQWMECVFYYGPTAKEVFEQHETVIGPVELNKDVLAVLPANRLPPQATPLSRTPIDSWDTLRALVGELNQRSLSPVLFPAFDLASLDHAPPDVRQRAVGLSTLLPILYRSSG